MHAMARNSVAVDDRRFVSPQVDRPTEWASVWNRVVCRGDAMIVVITRARIHAKERVEPTPARRAGPFRVAKMPLTHRYGSHSLHREGAQRVSLSSSGSPSGLLCCSTCVLHAGSDGHPASEQG